MIISFCSEMYCSSGYAKRDWKLMTKVDERLRVSGFVQLLICIKPWKYNSISHETSKRMRKSGDVIQTILGRMVTRNPENAMIPTYVNLNPELSSCRRSILLSPPSQPAIAYLHSDRTAQLLLLFVNVHKR
jgi:hypothetical protein